MMTSRIRTVAAVGLALGLALGGVRVVSAQLGGFGQGGRPRSDEVRTSYAGTSSLIAVETPEKDGIKVYSIGEGTWSEYRAPKGTRVRPFGFGGYVGASPEGPKITQLAAYTEIGKAWVTLDLPEPAEGRLSPIFSPNLAVYVAGRHVYAFSATASKWGALELPEGAEAHPTVSGQVATLLHEDRLYIFNAKFGRWDDSGDKPK